MGAKGTAFVINGISKLREKRLLFPVVLVLALCIGGGYLADKTGNPVLFIPMSLAVMLLPSAIVILIRINGLKKEKSNVANPLRSLRPHGVVFGKQGKVYIAKPEELDGHVLVVGGVGTGKSSCIAIPTLRSFGESVFAIDIKGELYEKTKGYRPNIKSFNPLDDSSYGYDPYFCLYHSDNSAQEARAIAQAVVPLPPDTKEPFWIESAQNIFTAAVLHFSAMGLSFLQTIQQIQGMPPKGLIGELCASPTRESVYFVNNFLGMDDKTVAGIVSELSKNIVCYVTDKNLISALSRKKNITPDDLEYGNDIYIQIPEHLLRQWKNLLTLIVNQFLTHFEKRQEANARPILFLLDEFPRLGKVSAMLDGLATLRAKKISICLIIQSLAQLDTIYGQNERKVISDTCAYKAILGATDADTQEYFSRLVGTYDKQVTSHGENREAFTGLPKGTSTNTYEHETRIIKPHEFGMLNDIVLLTPFTFVFQQKQPEGAPKIFFSATQAIPETSVSFCRVEKCPYYLESR